MLQLLKRFVTRVRLFTPAAPYGDCFESLTPALVVKYRLADVASPGENRIQQRCVLMGECLLARVRSATRIRMNPYPLFQLSARKLVFLLKKAELLSTLFVGIDIGSRSNVVSLMDFESEKPLQTFKVANNQPGAVELVLKLAEYLQSRKDLLRLLVALESTSFYGIHVANYLSTCEALAPFHTIVYCLNPKVIRNYKKSPLLTLARTTTSTHLSLPISLVPTGSRHRPGEAARSLLCKD